MKQTSKFQPNNKHAAAGGRARARKLSARKRKQIARSGWLALVQKRFHGDEAIAKEYMRALAKFHGDPYRDNEELSFGHTKPAIEEYAAKAYDASMDREIDFGMKQL